MHLSGSKGRFVIRGCPRVSPYIGLMFQRPHPVYFAFSEPRRVSLHMWFVFGAIDVLFIDGDRVVDIKRDFRPFRRYVAQALADVVVELPAGMVKDVVIGDVVKLS